MKNWSDYPIFLAVAQAGSLTAAGKALHMSQPTVGRRIRALEDHFGTALLKRENGQLVPTKFGQSMLDHIRRCLLYTSPSPRDATLSRMPSSA